ncbi:MAG: lysylphosphatidylglycerol synthase transmembrane domain-containing protein [Anaerolineae bacterium]
MKKDVQDRKRRRNRILNLLKVVISLGALIYVLRQVNPEQVLQLFQEMDWGPFLAALLLFLSGSLVRAYRWGSLVWSLNVSVSWWRLVMLYFVGSFFSLFLPTGVGGDAVKMYELSRNDHKVSAAISSVVVDRFLGLLVLFAIALLALVIGHRWIQPEVQILIVGIFGAIVILVVLLWQRSWLERWGRRLGVNRLLGQIKVLRELYESLHLYSLAALLYATLASGVWNLILIMGYYLLGQAVGIELSAWYYFLFVPVISALLMIPSVGGLGIREGGTVLLFSQVGVSEHQALALALAYDLTLLVVALIGAGIYIVQGVREARR